MDSLHGILVFQRVVEVGTFSGAARTLGVSTAAVSAALARLEHKLSVRLLNRTTRRLSVTAEGADFYSKCKQVTTDLEKAEISVSQAGRVPSGKLRVSMPAALGQMWVVPYLPEFVRDFPLVSLEIICSDFVPHTTGSGPDVSIQVNELHASRLAVRRLASIAHVVCASPTYLEERGAPRSIDDLTTHACLAFRRPRNGRLREWKFRSGTSVRRMALNGAMTFNSGETLVSAAVAGLGIIQVAEYYAQPKLESGALVEILADAKTRNYEISVVFPHQQPVAPKIRVFVDFLISLFDPPPWTPLGRKRKAS